MKLHNVATVEDQHRPTRLLMEMVRHKIFSLFDVQFILVTGRNREGESVTFDFLLRNLETYKSDFNVLASVWGSDHPLLKPIAMAITQICLFKSDVQAGKLLPHRNVSEFSCNVENRSFVMTLVMAITKALGSTGENNA